MNIMNITFFFFILFGFFILSFHGFFQSLHRGYDHGGEAMAVDRIRVLIESRILSKPRGYYIFLVPSPSPAPAHAPAPDPHPALAVSPHHNHHHPPTHQRVATRHGDIRRGHEGDMKRKLVAALVPAGVLLLLACVLGTVWFFGKCRGRRGRAAMFCGKNRGRRYRSRYTARRSTGSKATSSPGIDLFYLNSLGIDLERQTSRIQRDSIPVSNCDRPTFEEDTAMTERARVDSSDFSSSSTKEIVSVHDDAKSLKCDSDSDGSGRSCPGDEFPVTENAASDDESYHSIRDSNSQSCRFSDTLDCDITEVPEVKCPLLMNLQAVRCSDSSPLPPPPPPPPPPLTRATPRLSLSIHRTSPTSSANSHLLRNSISSQNSEPKQVPTPPSPPPLRKVNVGSIKTPPPPPTHFPRFAAATTDGGVSLPKLKPLHWDKVRATPDRCMVWDKLRSSSFE